MIFLFYFDTFSNKYYQELIFKKRAKYILKNLNKAKNMKCCFILQFNKFSSKILQSNQRFKVKN